MVVMNVQRMTVATDTAEKATYYLYSLNDGHEYLVTDLIGPAQKSKASEHWYGRYKEERTERNALDLAYMKLAVHHNNHCSCNDIY